MSSRSSDYRLRKMDWMALSAYLALVGLGWLMIYTVTQGDTTVESFNAFLQTPAGKQTIWIGISFLAIPVIFLIDWKFWQTFSYVIYIVALLLLIAVIFLGVEINGARSWFRFGGFAFQPAEIAKFATCLALASYLSTYRNIVKGSAYLLTAVALMLAPAALIMFQPDAGSALIFASFILLLYRVGLSPNILFIGGSMAALLILSLVFDTPYPVILSLITVGSMILYAQFKVKFYWIALGLIIAIASFFFLNETSYRFILLSNGIAFAVLGIVHAVRNKIRLVSLLSIFLVLGIGLSFSTNYAVNNFLEKHQQERIYMWLRPDKCDPSGPLYNVIQSKRAIGSGGFQGKGLFKGTMTKLNYVPEQSTDFIFCTVGEEQGFVGSVTVVGLFLFLLMRLVIIAERQRSNFSRHYIYGVAGILFFHVFINIGMTMGLVPIIGIPLPFISKGGSSLLGFTVMIAVVLKLDSNRYSI